MGDGILRRGSKSKTVSIDETHNVTYEIPTRWEYSEKQVRKMWYTRADIRQARQEHQEEVMMEQVRAVVEKRLDEEGTPERIDEVMGWPPTRILQYLETPVKKPLPPPKRISISDEDIMALFSSDFSKDLARKGKSSPTIPRKGKSPVKNESDDSSSSSSSSSSSEGDNLSQSSSSSSSVDASMSQTDASDSSSSSSEEDDQELDADDELNANAVSDSSSSSSSSSSSRDVLTKKEKDLWWDKKAKSKRLIESSDDDSMSRLDIAPTPPPPPPRSPILSPPLGKTDGKKKPDPQEKKPDPPASPLKSSPKKGKKKGKTKRKSSSSTSDEGNTEKSSIPLESSEDLFSTTNVPETPVTSPPVSSMDSGYHTDLDLGRESRPKLTRQGSMDQLKEAVQKARDRPIRKRNSPLAKQFQAAVQNVQVAMAMSSYLEQLGGTPVGLNSSYVPSDNEDESEDEKNKKEECPLCLGLVEAGDTTRIILVSQLLCKDCLSANENIIRNTETVVEASPPETRVEASLPKTLDEASKKKKNQEGEKKNKKKSKKKSSMGPTKKKKEKEVEKNDEDNAAQDTTSKKNKGGKSQKAPKKEENTGKKSLRSFSTTSTENKAGPLREKENDDSVVKEKGKKNTKDVKSSTGKLKKSKDGKNKDDKKTEKNDSDTKSAEVKSSDIKSKAKSKGKGKEKKKGKRKKTKLESFDELVKKGAVLGIEAG